MTPAINLLKKLKCEVKIHKYEHDTNCKDYGNEAVTKLNLNPNQVFKTLIIELTPKEFIVCILPVSKKLSLKDVAQNFGVKKATMANKDEAQKISGYLLGGVSPFGQKRVLRTLLDESANSFNTIFVSGGQRGLDIEIKPKDVEAILKAKVCKITQ